MKQGRQRGGGSLAFCSQFPEKSDKIHAAVLTIRKRNGRPDVARHGGIPESAFGPASGRGGLRGRRRAGLQRNKESRTRERKRVRRACLIWGCVSGIRRERGWVGAGVGSSCEGERLGRRREGGGDWRYVRAEAAIHSLVLLHPTEGRREPPRAPVRHLGPARNNTCPALLDNGVLTNGPLILV